MVIPVWLTATGAFYGFFNICKCVLKDRPTRVKHTYATITDESSFARMTDIHTGLILDCGGFFHTDIADSLSHLSVDKGSCKCLLVIDWLQTTPKICFNFFLGFLHFNFSRRHTGNKNWNKNWFKLSVESGYKQVPFVPVEPPNA